MPQATWCYLKQLQNIFLLQNLDELDFGSSSRLKQTSNV